MTGRSLAVIVLACAAAGLGCGGDHGAEPRPRDPGVEPEPKGAARDTAALTRLEITPSDAVIDPGEQLQLTVAGRDQGGAPMAVPGPVSYVIDDPAVATVSGTGLLTGVSPGRVWFQATVPVGGATVRGGMTATVRAIAADRLVLASGPRGWHPAAAKINVGGTVRWTTVGATDWAGGPHGTRIYLMEGGHRITDSLDLVGGTATRTFGTPGTVHYCTVCGEVLDFGVIEVR